MAWLDDPGLNVWGKTLQERKGAEETFRSEERSATRQSVSSQYFQNPSVPAHFGWVHAGPSPLCFYPAPGPVFSRLLASTLVSL